MRMTTAAAAMATFLALTAPAHAEDGKWLVKVMGTAVLPDGKITQVDKDLVGLPADLQTKANDNYVPTLAIEYFFTPNISVETICCMTQHDVDATTGLPGAELVSNAKIIPATFTLKYHLNAGPIRPYVGAGPSYFLVVSDKSGAATVAAGADGFKLDDHFGVALQAGFDIPLGEKGFALSFDAKRYFLKTSAHWYAGDTEVIATEHKLDPWLLSAGVGYRF